MTYRDYKNQRRKEFNDLPIFFAFTDKQFAEAMQERGLTANDTDKIYSFGTGGYYLKSDAEKIYAFMGKNDPLRELMMQDEEFAESAFYYEMENHEYHINSQGAWDVCECFGNCEYVDGKTGADYLREMGYTEKTVAAYKRARRKFLQYCDEYDLY